MSEPQDAPATGPALIAERVMRSIVERKLRPGERLGEKELAEVFGVSRTMVREALMLGLRTAEGVDVTALEQRVGFDPLAARKAVVERRNAQGDVVLEDGRLRVPHERWLHLDGIVADLF